MWKPGRPSAKLNEGSRLLAGPLGSFLLDLLTSLGIAEWIGYAFPLWYVSRLSLKPAVFLTFVALACTGLIGDAALPLMPRHQKYSSTFP
jgi:hypothetical protein